MLRRISFVLGVAVGLTTASAAFAADPMPTRLEPMTLRKSSLTILGTDGAETVYSGEALEEMPTFAMETRTPWRPDPARFEGVLLSDILRAHGLDGRDVIVTAENDFQVLIEHDVHSAVPILVATRVNGQPHSRRERGPIQFVIDEEVAEAGELKEAYFVWMAARIEAAD